MRLSATRAEWSQPRDPVATWGMALACLGYGALLAWTIAREKWLLAAAVFALVFTMLWPVELSLGLFAALVPFERVAALSHSYEAGNSLNWFVGAAGGAVLLVAALAGGRLVSPPKAAVWWGALIVWGSIVTMWAADPATALGRLPTAVALVLFYLAAVSIQIEKKELFHVGVLTVAGGVVAALMTASSYYAGLRWAGDVPRASLGFGNRLTDPNVLAASQLLPFALAFGVLISARRRILKVASALALGVIAYGVLLSMSRGAMASLFVVILVFLWRYRINWRIILTLSLLPLLMLVVPETLIFTRIQNSLSSHAAGRFDIWRAGVHALQDWWYCGAGFDNFAVVYPKYAGYAPRFGGYTTQAHNLYLSTSVDLGIVGLVLLIAAIVSQLRLARGFYSISGKVDFPMGVACEAACCGMIVMGMSLEILWLKSFWLCWILLAVAAQTWRSEQAASCL